MFIWNSAPRPLQLISHGSYEWWFGRRGEREREGEADVWNSSRNLQTASDVHDGVQRTSGPARAMSARKRTSSQCFQSVLTSFSTSLFEA